MNWFCIKCGKQLTEIKLDDGEFPCCFDCKIKYTIYGTGVDNSLFIAGEETLVIPF